MSCRISPLRGSRFNAFLAALVSMILICFHSQAAQTDTILFGIPLHCELRDLQSLLVEMPEGGIKGGSRLSVPHVLTLENTTRASPGLSHLHIPSYLSGASVWRHTWLCHSWQNKKRQSRWITALIQQRHIRACLSLSGLSVKATPKPLWKARGGDELWHCRGRLLLMTRGWRWRDSSPQTGYEKCKSGLQPSWETLRLWFYMNGKHWQTSN